MSYIILGFEELQNTTQTSKIQNTRQSCKLPGKTLKLTSTECSYDVIWFHFLREVIVAYFRHWIEIITVPLRFHVCHSEGFTLNASPINPSNRPTALYNSWNKLILNTLASPLINMKFPLLQLAAHVQTVFRPTKYRFFRRSKDTRKTKAHTRCLLGIYGAI